VPLGGINVGPDELQVPVTREQVKSAPNIEQSDESALYHQRLDDYAGRPRPTAFGADVC
jgi:hypothetical protein